MGAVKKILSFSVILFFYVAAVSVLLYQYKIYRQGFQVLIAQIEHPSIALFAEDFDKREEEAVNDAQ